MSKKRHTDPFSTSDLVAYLRQCRRLGQSKPAWWNREQMLLLSSVFGLRGVDIVNLRVSDVNLSRRERSYFELGNTRYPIRDQYTLSRMRVHMSRCQRSGRVYWLEGQYTGSKMSRDNLWRGFNEGVRSVFGRGRRLSLGSTISTRPNIRCSGERAMREMLSMSMSVPCGESIGEYLSEEPERSSFSSGAMQSRAMELSLTPERLYDIPCVRKHLRKLGLSGEVESRYAEFLGYLEIAKPGGSVRWRVCKFYEWVCEEVLDASRGESFDVSGGSWSGVDGVASVEGGVIQSDGCGG